MSPLAILCCLWVVVSALVAMLPMRFQYAPGLALMLAAPVLMYLLGQQYGIWVALIAALAFVSMYRNPLRYYFNRAFRPNPESQK